MNKTYRSVWNHALGAWVAVSEITAARGKRSGSVATRAGGGGPERAGGLGRCPDRSTTRTVSKTPAITRSPGPMSPRSTSARARRRSPAPSAAPAASSRPGPARRSERHEYLPRRHDDQRRHTASRHQRAARPAWRAAHLRRRHAAPRRRRFRERPRHHRWAVGGRHDRRQWHRQRRVERPDLGRRRAVDRQFRREPDQYGQRRHLPSRSPMRPMTTPAAPCIGGNEHARRPTLRHRGGYRSARQRPGRALRERRAALSRAPMSIRAPAWR